MINLMCKFLIILGLVASISAFILSSADALHFKCIANNGNINIQTGIGTDANNMVHILGTLAMVCFFIALLSISKTTVIVSDQKGSNLPTNSFLRFLQKFHRSKKDAWIGGICGGLSESTPIPSWAWRVLFLIIMFYWGIGILAYIILWVCVPEEILNYKIYN
ncbi:MAG: PspC domain-containing protein [Lentisphaerota bacterium]